MAHPYRERQPRSLGRLVHTHRFERGAFVNVMIWSGLFAAAGAPFVGLRSSADWACYVGCVAALELLMGWCIWKTHGARVDVFESGLVYTQRSGVKQVSWDEIESLTSHVFRKVRNGVSGPKIEKHMIRRQDGETLDFLPGLADIERLADTLRSKLVEVRLPVLREALHRGQTQTFGPLQLDSEGLSVGQRRLGWDAVGGTEISDGELTIIGLAGVVLPLHDVPNYPIALALIEEHRGARRPS